MDVHGVEKTGVLNAPLDAAKIDGRPIGDAINAGDATEDTSCGIFIFMVLTWEGRKWLIGGLKAPFEVANTADRLNIGEVATDDTVGGIFTFMTRAGEGRRRLAEEGTADERACFLT